jgi:hypothetical protein
MVPRCVARYSSGARSRDRRLTLAPRRDQRLPAVDRHPQDRNLRRVEMSEEKRHLRSKLFMGAMVVLVAMVAWVLIINISARH